MPELHSGGVGNYPDLYLQHRVWGHPWNPDTEDWRQVREGRKVIGWDQTINCACGAVKITEYDNSIMPVKSSKIDYSGCPGYLTAKGEKFSRHEARVERMKRLTGRSHLRRVQ